MDFLFRDRGQGKRQVKVSQDVVLLEDNVSRTNLEGFKLHKVCILFRGLQIPGEESSDDSEYLMNVSGLESVGSSTSGSDDEDKSSEEGEDDSNDENEDDACDEETREVVRQLVCEPRRQEVFEIHVAIF